MFAEVDINGDNADPLWTYLKGEAPSVLGIENIKWNFTKFLIGRDSQVAKRYTLTTKPEEIADNIERLLGQ
jgi:glutathione peroxidase